MVHGPSGPLHRTPPTTVSEPASQEIRRRFPASHGLSSSRRSLLILSWTATAPASRRQFGDASSPVFSGYEQPTLPKDMPGGHALTPPKCPVLPVPMLPVLPDTRQDRVAELLGSRRHLHPFYDMIRRASTGVLMAHSTGQSLRYEPGWGCQTRTATGPLSVPSPGPGV